MLMINDKLPASRTKNFYTVADGQSGTSIDIYESRSTDENMPIEGREPLTTIEMNFTRGVPRGTELEVTFMLDNSGILHVVAEEKLHHSKLDTTFTLSNQMTETEMRIAGNRLNNATVE